MFTRQTTLILGTGASLQYGYPTGQALINNIIDTIENKENQLYVPYLDKNNFSRPRTAYKKNPEMSDEPLPNSWSIDFLDKYFQDITNKQFFQVNLQCRSGVPNFHKYEISGGNIPETMCAQISFSDIAEFDELKEDLIAFDPVSIDKFLKDHPRHRKAGKIMIAYELLKCEKQHFFKKGETAFNLVDTSQKGENCDNWYRLLVNELTSGCKEPKDILKNKLDIISFNYDVSLDFYLRNRLKQIEFFNQNDSMSTFLEENFPIKENHHVYGKLHSEISEGDDKLECSGYGFEDLLQEKFPTKSGIDYAFLLDDNSSKLNSIALKNMIRLFNACRLSNNIEIIEEVKADEVKQNRFKEIIKNSEDVIIIGFGFDRDNQRILNLNEFFPRSYRNDTKKNFFVHNYKGLKKTITDQLSFLERLSSWERPPSYLSKSPVALSSLKVHESVADKIETAWVNDFMTRLVD